MNSQELETAVRLGLDLLVLILNDAAYGMIRWKPADMGFKDYGLHAGIFTPSLDHALRAWDELEVGGALINEIPSWRVDNMPYGGVKDSGLGREGMRYAMEDMT